MNSGRHEGEGPLDGVGFDLESSEHPESADAREQAQEQQGELHGSSKPARARKHRRVTTLAVPGSDPTPQPEPPRHAENENDDRLKADKPPHWG